MMNQPASVITRLGPTFHRTFSLVRPAVSQVLKVVDDLSSRNEDIQGSAFEVLRESTHLGTVYVAAMPRYAVGCGLLEDKSYGFTPLGRVVFEHDPDLNHPTTLWLMHYHLSAPQGPGPAYWHFLTSQEMSVGATLDAEDLAGKVRTVIKECDGTELADRSVRSAVTVFMGTYFKSDALGPLGILAEALDHADGSFNVLEPQSPSAWVIGYALAHYWDTVWKGAQLVHLSKLAEPGGFAALMFLGAYQLNSALRQLRSEGIVDLWQVAPPHQVARNWNEKETFLKRLYE
jgi:hypothetical protein